jgi:hypothetical protein
MQVAVHRLHDPADATANLENFRARRWRRLRVCAEQQRANVTVGAGLKGLLA